MIAFVDCFYLIPVCLTLSFPFFFYFTNLLTRVIGRQQSQSQMAWNFYSHGKQKYLNLQ